MDMLQTCGGMSTNFEKNNNAFIIFQCCVIATCCNETVCAMTRWMAIVKTRTTNILCLHSSICVCVLENTKKQGKNKKQIKEHEKNEEKKRKKNKTIQSSCM